jgi:RNA polymerase sigma factor (sigma-70 family)
VTENSTRQTGDHSDESYSPSDGSLVRQYRAGSETAADELYRRYAGRLRRLAWIKSMRSRDRRVDDSDIVQSVFRRFFIAARRGDYDIPQGEDLWNLLLVIALNKIRNAVEFEQSAKRDARRTVSMESAQDAATDIQSREDSATSFLRICVGEAMERLPADYAAAVQARMEGYEVQEIARRLSRSKRTVERILQESRVLLREYIGEDHS